MEEFNRSNLPPVKLGDMLNEAPSSELTPRPDLVRVISIRINHVQRRPVR